MFLITVYTANGLKLDFLREHQRILQAVRFKRLIYMTFKAIIAIMKSLDLNRLEYTYTKFVAIAQYLLIKSS